MTRAELRELGILVSCLVAALALGAAVVATFRKKG